MNRVTTVVVIKNKDNYLIKTDDGEYHLSIEEFEKLGEEKAIKLAKREISKKARSSFDGLTINFKQASNLGFCDYGIKDFCKKLELDIEKEYTIEYLNSVLTSKILLAYPDECKKLFGENVFKYLGGAKGFLLNNSNASALDLVLKIGAIPDKDLHKLACDFAFSVLPIFEKEFPNDERPRKAIEAKLLWLEGKISSEELMAARDSAWAAWAARDSAWAAWAARDSAWDSAWAARDSARDSAWYSARDSAWDSETQKQIKMVLKVLS